MYMQCFVKSLKLRKKLSTNFAQNKLIAFIILSTVPFTTFAQVDKVMFAECANKDSKASRLSCYDSLAKLSGVSPMRSVTKSWKTKISINPFDDSNTVLSSLESAQKAGINKSPISFVIMCKSGITSAYIDWHSYLGNKAIVTTRIGTSPMSETRWNVSNDGTASFSREPKNLIRSMIAADSMVAKITPYNANSVTATFKTAGLNEAVKPVLENCNWELVVKPEPISTQELKVLNETLETFKTLYGVDSPEYKKLSETYKAVKHH